MEIANAVYNADNVVDLQPQDQTATIHVNPTSEDPMKDGMSNPTYIVQIVTSEAKDSRDPNTEEAHTYCTEDDVQ